MTQAQGFLTHEVFNQAPPPTFDLWGGDVVLREAITREGGGWGAERIAAYAKVVADELIPLGFTANENRPKLKLFDRYGHRLDEVEFHPAYHRLMQAAVQHQAPTLGWREATTPGAHVARFGLAYLHTQADQGTGCPLTMTYACVPSLKKQPELAAVWLPKILSTDYDGRFLPMAQKTGVTIGMGMTEKQGGSDVRSNTTKAVAQGARGPGQAYTLVGHKWFFSAPMCDAFLVLAQAEGGLSCFLLPRWAPDGTRNAIRIQRLKDKLGDWSNASSEVEFHGATAFMVGDEGRGVPTILEMVALTRQDCMIGSAGVMRQALVHAVHHARHRKAFGKRLVEQPLMRNVLADLALELEGHVALTARVARAVDASSRGDAREAAFCRIATAVGKYWVCKRTSPFVNEAQECLGGQGYVEESMLPRLYRQAPLNSIWEGSGNIQCLDVLRAAAKEPESREALFAELQGSMGAHPVLDQALAKLARSFESPETLETRSRLVVEQLALCLQAALLLKGDAQVGDAFCVSRLGGQHGLAFGTLPDSAPMQKLIDRALPA